MQDHIEKSIELAASVERVWRALTDHREFGEWFRVKLDAPFAVDKPTSGVVTYPGYEHVKWEVMVETMDSERLFAFRWHPYAVDPDVDYSGEPTTLVEFRLEPVANGTRLVVTESGFDAIPEGRRAEALRMNDGGWAQQVLNVQAHVQS